jgi:hypothetical protein
VTQKKLSPTDWLGLVDFGSPSWARTNDLRINSPMFNLSKNRVVKLNS